MSRVADPVSWLQIEQGWIVVSSDGTPIGTVAQIAGDTQDDIFDGLAVKTGLSEEIGYVPGEQVGAIYPGEVRLKLTAADAQTLAPYHEAAAQTKWEPGKPPLGARVSNWLRGKR